MNEPKKDSLLDAHVEHGPEDTRPEHGQSTAAEKDNETKKTSNEQELMRLSPGTLTPLSSSGTISDITSEAYAEDDVAVVKELSKGRKENTSSASTSAPTPTLTLSPTPNARRKPGRPKGSVAKNDGSSVNKKRSAGKEHNVLFDNIDFDAFGPRPRNTTIPTSQDHSENGMYLSSSAAGPSASSALIPPTALSAMARACQYGQLATVETLLRKHPLLLDLPLDAGHNTALHEAVVYDRLEVVRLLLKRGASIETRNLLNESVMELIRGAKVKEVLEGWKRRRTVQDSGIFEACEKGNVEKARDELEKGFGVDEKSDFGNTALHEAALFNHPVLITLLHSYGANLDAFSSSPFSNTALHEAILYSSSEAVQRLLELGASMLLRNGRGELPIELASKPLRRLLRRHAKSHGILCEEQDEDVFGSVRDEEREEEEPRTIDERPLGFTRDERKLQQALSILNRSSPNRLPMTIEPPRRRRGRPRNSLAGMGKDKEEEDLGNIDARDGESDEKAGNDEQQSGNPRQSNVPQQQDIEPKLDPFHKDKGTGRTLLHRYSARGSLALVQKLLSLSALPSAADHAGYTPLHVASLNGHLPVVKALLLAGADVNAKSLEAKDTALHDAAENGHEAVVRLLVEEGGAKLTLKNRNGQRPVDVAANEAIKQYLSSRLPAHKDDGSVSLQYSASPVKEQQILTKKRHKSGVSTADSASASVRRKPGRPRKNSLDSKAIPNTQPKKSPLQKHSPSELAATAKDAIPALVLGTEQVRGSAKRRKRFRSPPIATQALSPPSALHSPKDIEHLLVVNFDSGAGKSGRWNFLSSQIERIHASLSGSLGRFRETNPEIYRRKMTANERIRLLVLPIIQRIPMVHGRLVATSSAEDCQETYLLEKEDVYAIFEKDHLAFGPAAHAIYVDVNRLLNSNTAASPNSSMIVSPGTDTGTLDVSSAPAASDEPCVISKANEIAQPTNGGLSTNATAQPRRMGGPLKLHMKLQKRASISFMAHGGRSSDSLTIVNTIPTAAQSPTNVARTIHDHAI